MQINWGGETVQKLKNAIISFFRHGDLLLLTLCTVTSVFGIVIISSAAKHYESNRYVLVQLAALLLGILLYIAVSLIDIKILTEHRWLLLAFNAVFIAMLVPWGVEGTGGNKAWLHIPGLPFNVQPAEICKITFILILAKTLSIHRKSVSSPRSVLSATLIMLFTVGLIIVASSDAGSALVFAFIFLVILFVGGVRGWWFLGGAVITAAFAPFVWEKFVREDQKNRILMFFDPTIDPTGEHVRWDTNRSVMMLSGGGVTGQGLYKGTMTQQGAIAAQHTDFVFSSIGEELGIIGCIVVLLLLAAIVVRCIKVGLKAPNYTNRLICFGISAMLIVQILINVGMCIGVFPVIGLTLPFISYGGSSVVTMFLAMGIVSGIHMRPDPDNATVSPYIQYRY